MKIFIVTIALIVITVIIVILFYVFYKRPKMMPEYDTKENFFIDNLSLPYWDNGKVNTQKLFNKKYMNNINQKENLILLKKFFDLYNIKYFIDCGTLLGAVRESDLILGDTDADITTTQYYVSIIRKNLPYLEKLGFISFRNRENDEWYLSLSLLRKGEYIDIYSMFNTKDIPFETINYPFIGNYFSVPKYYDEWLTETYGNWRVPVKDGKGLGNWEKGNLSYIKKFSNI